MKIKAVIFDLGGVLLDSPLDVFAEYEARQGLPSNFLNRLIVRAGPSGAWARLERGEIEMNAFFSAFDAEAAGAGGRISSAELMAEVALASKIRPLMVQAVRKIRSQGLKTAALTNNWLSEDHQSGYMAVLRAEFDVFVESCRVGLQKPDPLIYELVCRELGFSPQETVFLDDIGRNLKPARALGMLTIKVAEQNSAISELEDILGVRLRD
ncbi:MAG: HAD family phosphatase [Thermodesulfobacteriota bacterium]|nr:HAD family phosphatase [Thermodesulfobacteriota bacterium]